MTHLGFTGTYDMLYGSVMGMAIPELGVEVHLRVRWEDLQCQYKQGFGTLNDLEVGPGY